MSKYNYDKKALKGLTPFPFLGEVKERVKHIEAAEATIPQSVFNTNKVAKALHPDRQFVKVAKVIEHKDAKSFVLVPDEAKGTKALAYFRAGQYTSIALDMDGNTANKPYTIKSSPKDALGDTDNSYTLTIKHSKGGQGSEYILANWKEGTEAVISGPLGNFYYESIRDAKDVVALAGGSGITPFFSMASAIADGIEDFNLTIIYGSRSKDNILLKDELDEIEKRAGGKVKVVHVLSDEEAEGFEHGFITADLIKKYASKDYSIFVCGPKAMYKFLEKEIKTLKLPERRVRFEVSGEFGNPENDPDYPQDAKGKEFTITVNIRGEVKKVPCKAETSLLRAMEAAGIRVPSDCRSGECGWCHSRLISGEVFVPQSVDGRRIADKKFNWIHPCNTYALSDVEVEVFPLM